MAAEPSYPACRPRCIRQMAVGDGHVLHVEECGAADGLPVVFFHEGLGRGCQPEHRRLFDPQRYRVIMIDLRGTGRSLPLGELDANTTADLVCDIEYIREALAIPSWIIFGVAWGSLLGLAYAQLFPERVLGLVLCGIFLGSAEEIAVYTHGLPGKQAAWQDFAEFVPADERHDLMAAYTRRILGDDPLLAAKSCHALLNYRQALLDQPPLLLMPDDAQQAEARLQIHYLRHRCFIAPGQLLAGMGRMRHLPGAIVQGMADPLCLPNNAVLLHRAWPEATWFPVAGGGFGSLSPSILRACTQALGWMAACVEPVI